MKQPIATICAFDALLSEQEDDGDATTLVCNIHSLYLEEDDGIVTMYMGTNPDDSKEHIGDCHYMAMDSKQWRRMMRKAYFEGTWKSFRRKVWYRLNMLVRKRK